jgi:copper chaperone CopZ
MIKAYIIGIFTFLMIMTGYTQVQTVHIQTSAQCEMCKKKIEKKVMMVKGVKNAVLDMKTKTVTVKYDTQKVQLNTIKTAITLAGYDADEMKADEKAYSQLEECCKKKK